MEVTRTLARNIINVDYSTLPSLTTDMTKKLILDALACALSGSSGVGMKQLNELIEEWGGKEESTVVAFGSRVPSPHAALVNGSMGRSLDFDDTYDLAIIHGAVPTVFAGFAVAEHKGGVGGKDFITAVTLGIDLAYRLSAATPINMLEGYGWDYSTIYGPLSSAATSAKILGLDEDKLLNAMGIAYHQASGTMCQIFQGHTAKGMGSGFAGRGGVTSALMAEKGLTGSNEPLAGKWGMYDVFQRGEFIRDKLIGGLGKTFLSERGSLKPYPCCRVAQPFIDATLALVEENDIKFENVDNVIAYAGKISMIVAGEPLELKQNPPNSVASQFSIPWAVANAIAFRDVELKHFSDEALKNQDVCQLAQRVAMQLEPELSRTGTEPAVVEIKMKDGNTYSKRIDHFLGSPENPLSMEGVAKKFRNCAGYATKLIAKEKLEQVVQMVKGLEDVTDVGQIIRLLE